ncbi:MAG TPA: YetF domain-containing protein [Rhizomicrobium sp.]|jgi:uncharacterized membrane protein YcaP (DUF421 family)|nr:YetF domain-containing protein [Rhizomicrobium sp.]
MDTLVSIFGEQDNLSLGQECARAIVIFFYAWGMLRLSGRRTFAHWSALDIVVSFIIGSALGRVVTGSAPFLGTLAAVAVIVGLHVLIARAVAGSPWLARIVEGRPVVLVDRGQIDQGIRRDYMIAMTDLQEAMRQEGLDWPDGLENAVRVVLEANGKISVIKKEPCKPGE